MIGKTQKKAQYYFITPLNAVRFFAAVAIVVFHFGRWSYPFNLSFVQPFALLSNTGVTLFFVLSGFIMVHVYGKRLQAGVRWAECKQFYTARIARIVPVYLIALGATLGYVVYAHEPWTLKSLLTQITFLQAWFPHESLKLNFTAWSLSVEMFFYLLFPFLLVFLAKKTWTKRIILVAPLWAVSNIISIVIFSVFAPTKEAAEVLFKFFPLLHVNSFVIGMIAGMWYQDKRSSVPLLLLLASVFVLALDPIFVPDKFNALQHNGLLAPLFAIIILAVAESATEAKSRWLSFQPFVIGGDASYGIYILQAPVYWWVYKLYHQAGVFDRLGESGRFFVYLILLILVSIISRFTIEVWAKRLILRKV